MISKTVTLGRITAAGILLLVFGCHTSRQTVTGESTRLPNTVLWEIGSDELDAPSYLFGTIHLIPEEMYFWPDHFQKAYASTGQVALETNELDMDPVAMMGLMPRIMLPKGERLEDLVSEAEYDRIRDYFDEMGLPLMFLQKVKPFFLYMLVDIDLGSLFSEGIKSYEMEITEKAKKDNKPVLGLESLDYQISIFDSIPYSAQADMLVQAIDEKQNNTDSDPDSKSLYQTYVDQDLNAILTQVQETEVAFKKFNKIFLDQRNNNWIPKIEKYMHKKPTFIAVGAAHLPGSSGVIHLLEEAGYTLTPILSQPDGAH